MKVSIDSMLFWYPKIRDLPIPKPKTEILILTNIELEKLYDESVPESLTKKIREICDKIGYPCFLRTDLASGKHEWKKSCFINGKTSLWQHIYEVVVFNMCADLIGLDFKALVVREYIPMASEYTAFWGEMPVNPERRYFVKDGAVLCHHPYWVEEAIENPSATNWRELSQLMNKEDEDEIRMLSNYAKQASNRLRGYWSIDFCKAKDGRWILIDVASGKNSWHPTCTKILDEATE